VKLRVLALALDGTIAVKGRLDGDVCQRTARSAPRDRRARRGAPPAPTTRATSCEPIAPYTVARIDLSSIRHASPNDWRGSELPERTSARTKRCKTDS